MLLSTKLIKTQLEKIYPEIIFNTKYSENFINVIRLNILQYLNKLLSSSSKEEAISIITTFSFKTERTNENFDSIYKIDDDLIELLKKDILESINPEHYLVRNNYISQKEEGLILSLLLYKDIVLNQENTYNSSIKELSDCNYLLSKDEVDLYIKSKYDSSYKRFIRTFKDTSLVRDTLFNKKFINSDRELLFNIRYESLINDFIQEFKFRQITLFLRGSKRAGYNNVYIDMSEILFKDGLYTFKTSDNLKAYFSEKDVSKYDLHFTANQYNKVISFYNELKDIFINYKI